MKGLEFTWTHRIIGAPNWRESRAKVRCGLSSASIYLGKLFGEMYMNVSCLQETLNKGLGIVGRAVATRTTLPITQNVLISTDQGRLKLTATNLEVAISTWIGATVVDEGDITIPARLLSEFVSSLQNEKVDMVTTTQPQAMTLTCARYEARMTKSILFFRMQTSRVSASAERTGRPLSLVTTSLPASTPGVARNSQPLTSFWEIP